jgi:hypothetical protein
MHVQAKSNAQITVPLNGETTVQWKSIDIFLNIKGDCPTHAKKKLTVTTLENIFHCMPNEATD